MTTTSSSPFFGVHLYPKSSFLLYGFSYADFELCPLTLAVDEIDLNTFWFHRQAGVVAAWLLAPGGRVVASVHKFRDAKPGSEYIWLYFTKSPEHACYDPRSPPGSLTVRLAMKEPSEIFLIASCRGESFKFNSSTLANDNRLSKLKFQGENGKSGLANLGRWKPLLPPPPPAQPPSDEEAFADIFNPCKPLTPPLHSSDATAAGKKRKVAVVELNNNDLYNPEMGFN